MIRPKADVAVLVVIQCLQFLRGHTARVPVGRARQLLGARPDIVKPERAGDWGVRKRQCATQPCERAQDANESLAAV
jgi:hypothetical protein